MLHFLFCFSFFLFVFLLCVCIFQKIFPQLTLYLRKFNLHSQILYTIIRQWHQNKRSLNFLVFMIHNEIVQGSVICFTVYELNAKTASKTWNHLTCTTLYSLATLSLCSFLELFPFLLLFISVAQVKTKK